MESASEFSLKSRQQRVLRFLRENFCISNQTCLIVAVSGGPDSVCLLEILSELKEELGVSLHVAHCNHRLRGAESDGDAAYVARLADTFGLPCTVGECDVEGYRLEHRLTLEEAAREVRYAFLAETAAKVGTDCVAVGHTRDDNVETILLHLVRGTGTRGLRGLQPVTPLVTASGTIRVIRPLLEISREETVAYCRTFGLETRLDSSNLSLSPLRNRIRQQLLPLLYSYNERFDDAILRTASAASDELDYMDSVLDTLETGLVTTEKDTVILDREFFISLPPALKRHLLRKILDDVYGSLKDIETRHIEDVIALAERQSGKRIDLPGGLVCAVEYDRFLIGFGPAELSSLPFFEGEHELTVPGETEIAGWKITASVIERTQIDRPTEGFLANFDFDKTGDRLTVRPRKTADRFQPCGMTYTKKLGHFMTDAKIPRLWRDRVPVVCIPEQIIWLAGYRIDERVRVTDDTTRVLRLEFRQ